MVIKFYNIFSTFTTGEWYSYFCTGKKKNSKQKRLLYDCFQHFVLNYPFLDETQQWGKAYQLLGIPHVCGKVDKEKLKKKYAEEKKDNARITKLKVQLKPGTITMNNKICEKDWKCLNMEQQQSQLPPRQEELRESYSNKIVNNIKATYSNQISHELVLDQVYKSEIQSKKRVRFNNVQILCFDKSNSSESEVSTSTLLINETSKQKVNNKNERIIHKPYFERLNDSISSESNTDNEVNNNNLTSAFDSLREAESEFSLNKGKPDHEDRKELPTRETQSNESDIRNLLDILSDENDNRILLPCDRSYNKDSDIYSSSDTKIKIIPSFPEGYEEDDTLSSDSLMNDHDTGIMSPYTSDDELRNVSDHQEPTTIREQCEEKVENEVTENNEKLNDNQRKSTIILEVRNLASDELSEVTENTRESSNEKIYSTSDEYPTNLEGPFTDKINFSEKNINNDVDNEISKFKNQNSNKETQKESNDNPSGDIQENVMGNTNSCDRKCEENEAEDQIQREPEKGNIVISPLSSESSMVEHFISLIPSGNLMGPTIGNIENFRLNSSATFSQESSIEQKEFGFGNNVTINKSSVLGQDNAKEQILSSDSFSRSNSTEEQTKEKNLITGSQCNVDRINSNSNELLNDLNKNNRIEVGNERLKSKEGFPIISDTDTTTTGSSENIIQSSFVVDSGNKREPLRSISNVLPKLKNSAGINIIRNRDHRNKENVAPDMSDQISPKRNMSREAPPKGSFISDSSSHELDKISGLEEESSHDEDIVPSSCHNKITTDNNGTAKMGKVTQSDGSDEKSSLSSDLGTGKNYKTLFQKLKNSTNENRRSNKNKLILSRKTSSPEEARETGFVNQVLVLSDDSVILTTSPKDLNNKEKDDKSCENLQEEPNICESMKENRVITDINSKNISQNVDEITQMPTKQLLTFKTAPTTINSSDSWSSKEYLLRNFNERISKVGKKEKQEISKKSSDIMPKSNYCFENLNNGDAKFAESSARESIVRRITSVLNDSTLSSPDILDSDEESEQFNTNSSFSELSSQLGKVEVTDLGVNAFFNERMKISLDSSSNTSIHGTPDDNNYRSSTASQQINNLNLINPETSTRNYESQLMSDAGQLDHKNYSLGSNDDENIDINKRESVTSMNVSSNMENELDSVNKYKRKVSSTGTIIKDHDADCSSDSCIVLSHKKITSTNVSSIIENELDSVNKYKRKVSSTGTIIKDHDADCSSDSCIVLSHKKITSTNVSSIIENELDSVNKYKRKVSSTGTNIKRLDMEDHDADCSSDSCIVVSHKKIKRRRKKASRAVVKLKNLPPKDNNNKHQTSSDDTEFINEILDEKKKEKLKPTSKKTTTTNSMLINVINEIEEEKTTGNDQQKMQQSIAVDKNQSVSNISNSDMIYVDYDSIGGQRISQEVRKLRKTSIVKQQINSSDTSTTSEYISSALARRIYYL